MTNQALHDHLIGENGASVFLNNASKTTETPIHPFTHHPIGRETLESLVDRPNDSRLILSAIESLIDSGAENPDGIDITIHENKDDKTITISILNAQITDDDLIESSARTYSVEFTATVTYSGSLNIEADSEHRASDDAYEIVDDATNSLAYNALYLPDSYEGRAVASVELIPDVEIEIDYVSEA